MKRSILILTLCLTGIAATAADKPAFQIRPVRGPALVATNGDELMTVTNKGVNPGDVHMQVLAVQKEVLLDQSMVKSAMVAMDRVTGRLEVDVLLTDKGRTRFTEATRQYVHRELAIIVNGQILSAPIVQNPIVDGRAIISGDFTEQAAKELAAKITNQ